MANNVVFEAEDVSKNFILDTHNVLSAVDGVSFSVLEGQCLGVIGESGCGKSTLAKIATGVESATSGSVRFLGQEMVRLSPRQMHQIRRDMQMIFQNPLDVISPRMKIGDFLLEPYINYKILPTSQAKSRIIETLAQVWLTEEVLQKYPHQLSGGELQRVCIARAFGLNPKLLICDEITSALDVSVQDEVMQLFQTMRQNSRTACLMICHDLALVKNYSDQVLVMYLGQAVEYLPSKDLGTKAAHPYTRGLLRSILFVGTDRNQEINILEGEPQSPINPVPCCRFCSRCAKATPECFREKPAMRRISIGHFVACHNI